MNNDFPFNHFFNSDDKTSNTETKDYNFPKINKNFENVKENQILTSEEFTFEELQSITEEINTGLKNTINPQKYKAFFENSFAVKSISEETIQFSVTTNFIKKMINNHYLQNITEIVSKTLGKEYKIEILLIDEKKQHIQSTNLIDSIETINDSNATSISRDKPSFKLDFGSNQSSNKEIQEEIDSKVIKHNNSGYFARKLDGSKTFNNFIVGPSNNMAYAFSLAVAKDPGKVYPQLYIHGNSGLGKTHILHALCNHIAEKKPHLRICFTNANEFMSEMVVSIQKNETSVFRRKYTELVDVLIIDDIHELKNKTRTQAEFFYIFNELQSKGKQLVFTSDKAPKEISGIEDRIRTRLSSALLIDIHQPDLETRIAILRKKALEKDIYLDDDVINLIASCVKTNVRELEGNLVKLGAYSDLMNVDIDLEIAKEQLNLTEGIDDRIITVESIAKAVSGHFKLALGDIKGKTRKKEVALARHIAMYMSHKILKKTLEEIGEYFDNRDHSTVIHGIKKIQNLLKEDSKVSQMLYEIESRL